MKLLADGSGDPWYDREIGVTLFQVNRRSGRITRLRIGPPHTGSISGHQQWIGKSGKVLLSSGHEYDDGRRKGNLMEVAADSAPRVVSDAGRFSSHVHASVCGRIFCCDELRTKKISIGSIRTGNAVEICDFGPFTKELYASYGQPSHAHPYLSPDLRWIVFNSCRTGRPQIHVASIPETITADLLAQCEPT